jgi:hypothetical protein
MAVALAVVGALGIAPAATAVDPLLELHETFTAVKDGPAPAALVGGTAAVTNYSGSPAAAPYVRDGYLTTTNPDTAVGGAYRIARLDADVTTIGATFAFTASTADGGVLCLSIQADNIATTSPAVPVSPIHFIISPTGWGLDVNTEAGTGVDGLIGDSFEKPLAADGKTLHRVEVVLDRSAAKARITFPDGSTRTFTNPAFALAGEHVYVEPFTSPNGGPIAEQTHALVSEWWAGTAPVTITDAAEVVPELRAPLPVLVAEVAPVEVAPAVAAPPVVSVVAAPEKPRGVRSVRHGVRVVTTWRATDSDVRVKCGTASKVVDRQRVSLRSAATRCKVRTVGAQSSPWVSVQVR